jgi:glycerol-3-phosphate dehydrogenase
LNRAAQIEKLSSTFFDLLIIGGGITGAGIALDAASRGLSVALVEQEDFASGTSSRSTKLIHGGLRYLKQGDIALVREVGRERAILFRNAPHVIMPEKMLMPFTSNGSFGKTISSIGLSIYDWLAGVPRKERRKILNASEAKNVEPLLESKDLLGAALYYEYRTDDARLTIDTLKTAQNYGATVLNYLKVSKFLYDNGKIVGANVKDAISSSELNIKAKYIVNAAGPWVDKLRMSDDETTETRLHLTKGVHLVVPFEKFPVKQSIYFDVPGGRMLFAIPRGNTTYFGTTDTDYNGTIANPSISKADVNYLLNSVNSSFPTLKLKESDIISSWVGLRPLINKKGKKSSELSRKDEIFESKSGLISIAGGKLTGYRKMAERVVNLISEKPCITKNLPIIKNTSIELEYTVENEWVENIQDYAIRRTGMLYFEPQNLRDNLNDLVSTLAKIKNWDSNQEEIQIENMNKLLFESLKFKI